MDDRLQSMIQKRNLVTAQMLHWKCAIILLLSTANYSHAFLQRPGSSSLLCTNTNTKHIQGTNALAARNNFATEKTLYLDRIGVRPDTQLNSSTQKRLNTTSQLPPINFERIEDCSKDTNANDSGFCTGMSAMINDDNETAKDPSDSVSPSSPLPLTPPALRGPKHIAFICDGNSRWAERIHKNGKHNPDHKHRNGDKKYNPKTALGHQKGASRVVSLVQHISQHHPSVEYITMYGFSSENWSRSTQEIYDIWAVMEKTTKKFSCWAMKEGMKVKILGDLDDGRIPNSLRFALRTLEMESVKNSREYWKHKSMKGSFEKRNIDANNNDHPIRNKPLTLCIAVNYGGRNDIVNASIKLAKLIARGEISSNEVDVLSSKNRSDNSDPQKNMNHLKDKFDTLLCTDGIPDPDMVVRTGGERRLSNFLIWNCAYSELYFTDVLWPDFDSGEMDRAMVWYHERERRFGGRLDQVKK